ncbi:MAG: protein phosphatase 2C domain-containing protein [Anaerolineales bacterium]
MRKFLPEIESGGLSVIGPVREDNQDSIRLPDGEYPFEAGALFAIADGMGGYSHGGVASLLALESFFDMISSQNGGPIPKALQRGFEAANLQVYKKAQQLDAGRMGTTLTAAYVFGEMLYLAHVGDSRAYLIRDGRSICLTADHTTVGDMVRSKLISSDKIRTHAQRSILTRSIGTSLFVQPDIIQQKLREGDRLVLCSDGVWSVIEDEEFAQVTNDASSVDEASRNLIDLALDHNTDDNASVIVFHLRRLIPISSEQPSDNGESLGWFQKLRKLVS